MKQLKRFAVACILIISLSGIALAGGGETNSPPGETSSPPGETLTPPGGNLLAGAIAFWFAGVPL